MSPNATAARPRAAPAHERPRAGPAAPHGCRFCGEPLRHLVLDLGVQPLCESYVPPERYWDPEPAWPLRAYVCDTCWLVQVPELVTGTAIYSHYAYFSSYSDSWLAHARRYAEAMVERFGLGPRHRVVEIASNDGYLLQYFVERGIPCLGIEPAANVAQAAIERGVPTDVRFFGEAAARELVADGFQADLLVANNVIGHVPELNDFLAGLATMLAPGGTLTIEIPHLLKTMTGNQFDQIYQEHYSYWSFLALQGALAAHGLAAFDVEELPTHGGSMRVYARHADAAGEPVLPAVEALRAREQAAGLTEIGTYTGWNERAAETKRRLLAFLIDARRAGRRIAAYGAPGKGNTLLNYCGIREDFIEFTVDRNPFKQGTYLPGTRIPVYAPEKLAEARPDLVLLLPWNLKDELLAQLAFVREWGGSFVVPVPEPEVIP